MENILVFLKSAFTIMIPVFFASMGGLFPALAGNLNIALEGLLLTGAFSSLTIYFFTGSIAVSVTGAVMAVTALCALHAFAAFKLRSDMFITGMAVNLLSAGLCAVLSEKIFKTRGVVALG
ncbi:MAG: ABC transporter permease, partial [Treponema sp.]|nr:ABC transporter permease [Treponema sp.]